MGTKKVLFLLAWPVLLSFSSTAPAGFIIANSKLPRTSTRLLSNSPSSPSDQAPAASAEQVSSEAPIPVCDSFSHIRESMASMVLMLAQVIEEARIRLRPAFEEVDRRTQRNLKRVLDAFRQHQVRWWWWC